MKITYIALLMCLVLSSFAAATNQQGSASTTFVTAPAPTATVATTTATTTAGGQSCPTEAELGTQMKECEAKGLRYTTYAGDDGCKQVKCYEETADCPSEEDITRKIANCPDNYATTTDPNGCTYKYCAPTATTTCPSNIEEQIRKCKAANLDYEAYGDENGCKQVRCRNNEKVECKKYVSDGCVIFSCNDGYLLNLCNYCQPECKVYTDDAGCTVKDCGNGQSSRACPITVGAVAPAPDVTTSTQTVSVEMPTAAGEETQLNPQPEPPKPVNTNKLKSKPVQSEEVSDSVEEARQATQLNPQPEPPAPKGFFNWFKGLFGK